MEGIKMKAKLDNFEKEIENNAESYKSISKGKMSKITSIIDETRKTKNINIRISEYDLEKLREKSAVEGLPYQTLLSSIIHKYVSDQLVEEKDIIKSIQLLRFENT
jgi:predicted DNA binding CopG/RHH family protein